MGLLKFEWGKDLHGNSVLIVRKKHGKISVSELQEEMSRDYRFQGGWAATNRKATYWSFTALATGNLVLCASQLSAV